MVFTNNPRRDRRIYPTREKERLGIAVAKRLKHFVPTQEIEIQFGKTNLVIESKSRLQIVVRQKLTGDSAELLRKKIDILFMNRQTGSHFVSAVFLELALAMTQRLYQVKTLDAATASFAESILVKTNHDCRAMILVHNPRRHDAKHAGMPAARPYNDGCITRRIELFRDRLFYRREHLLLNLLPLAVLFIQNFRKLRCFDLALGQKQLKRLLRGT